MSVINTMLRDLDRRHAPAPLLAGAATASIATTPIETRRRGWMRPALALCALAVILGWGWRQHSASREIAITPATPLAARAIASTPAPATANLSPTEISAQRAAPAQNNALAAEPAPKPAADSARSSSASPVKPTATALTVAPESPATASPAGAAPAEIEALHAAPVRDSTATLVKQSRPDPTALATERYQAARVALAQGQIERAYELLIDNPPALADFTDYHAVLAAVEQQLGRYADAATRYRQLLQHDGHQASWWLGLALSLDGGGHRAEAKNGFARALALNTLPQAAHDYAAGRIAVLERDSASTQELNRGH